MSHSYFMVRAMSQTEEDFQVFFAPGAECVAVGWSDVNFSVCTGDALVEAVRRAYYNGSEVAPQVVAKKLGEVRRFKSLRTGDRVVVPRAGAVVLAKVLDEERCSTVAGEARDLANQRSVTYMRDSQGAIAELPRDLLTEGLQRRLRVRGSTIADLAEFGEEIENLFHLQTYNATIAKRLRDQEQAFRDKLLANIREGRTSLSGGGNGLEKLVKELLEIDGYTAKVLSKRRFMGFADADVEATRNDHLSHTKLLIQVKHHSGVEETWGAKQLLEIVNQHGEEFADYELVLITTADAPLDLVKLCNAKGIQLMQGPQVVEWVQDALPRLSPETRARLGVALMPTVAD